MITCDVATSRSCRDISSSLLQASNGCFWCRDNTLWLCRFYLLVPDVATSVSCRDIGSKNFNFQLSMYDVATSFPCRDINLYLLRFLLLFFGVATSVFCRDSSLSFSSFINPNFSWLRGASVVATSILCRDISLCHDIMMLSRHRSFSLWLVLSRLSCDPCRDLHQIPSIFLMSRPHNWTVHTLNCINDSVSRFHFCSTIRLHFFSTYCCIFLLSFSLPANNKLVSFFIFLYINYAFLDENQTEKWTKNR